jgi:hypothetical protein
MWMLMPLLQWRLLLIILKSQPKHVARGRGGQQKKKDDL